MIPTHKPTRQSLLAIATIVIGTAASCNLNNADSIDFAYEGRVLDADTNEPIEGAYALAVYEKVDLGAAGSSRNCIKTKGMTTGKDGKFNFPIDRLDGTSPSRTHAIKSGYYDKGSLQVPFALQRAQNKQTYTNRDVYLKKQDPNKLEGPIGQFRLCERPESEEAIQAGIRFLEIEIAEKKRLGLEYSTSEYFISSMREKAPRQPAAR